MANTSPIIEIIDSELITKAERKLVIPLEFMEAIGANKKLTANARLYLIAVSFQENGSQISEKQIQNLTGMSHATYIRARELLEELGFIEIISGEKIIIHHSKILNYK